MKLAQMNNCAREVFPQPVMASVASCFEIAGHQATDALAQEIWEGGGTTLSFPGGWSIELRRVAAKKREKREFSVFLRLDCGEEFVGYMYKLFPVTEQGFINMVHHLRECRKAVQRGLCDCEGEPRPERLRMSVGKCTAWFLASAIEEE